MNSKFSNTINLFCIALCVASTLACFSKEKPVKFAIASDFHAQDIPDGKERLESFIQAAKANDVDFVIELGDFCRLDSASQVYLNIWNSFDKDKYHVIGNHDMDAYTVDQYVAGMKMPNRYYSFDKGDFHFIVLDGNNIYDGQKYYHYAKANYYIDAKKRAFVDPEQVEWLKQDLRSTSKRCIIFSHQSIDMAMGNRALMQQILQDENKRVGYKKVLLAFSGHNHSNYTKQINGITYMQINSASYVWIDQPSMSEKRYAQHINQKYSLLKNSITYDKPLYAIVTLSNKSARVKGVQANFMPPTPKELNMGDSIGLFPLVSSIQDAVIKF